MIGDGDFLAEMKGFDQLSAHLATTQGNLSDKAARQIHGWGHFCALIFGSIAQRIVFYWRHILSIMVSEKKKKPLILPRFIYFLYRANSALESSSRMKPDQLHATMEHQRLLPVKWIPLISLAHQITRTLWSLGSRWVGCSILCWIPLTLKTLPCLGSLWKVN